MTVQRKQNYGTHLGDRAAAPLSRARLPCTQGVAGEMVKPQSAPLTKSRVSPSVLSLALIVSTHGRLVQILADTCLIFPVLLRGLVPTVACSRQSLDPKHVTSLPFLFSLQRSTLSPTYCLFCFVHHPCILPAWVVSPPVCLLY